MDKRNYEHYTEAEKKQLLELRKKGVQFRKIAELMPQHSQDSLRVTAWNLAQTRGNEWLDEMRIGFFDVECDNLSADYGKLLSWAIKERDGDTDYDFITRSEAINPKKLDYRIMKTLCKAMREYDVLVGFYSGDWKFDFPYVRSRAMYWGLDFPTQGELLTYDLWPACKRKMKLSRTSLDNVTKFLHIPGKDHVEGEIWLAARVGDKEAMEYVVNHNLVDCEITEELFERILPYVKIGKTSI